jgi:hypothetical protein
MIEVAEIKEKCLIAFQKILEDIMVEANVWEFTEYLDRIGATDLYRPIGLLLEQYKKLYNDEILDIFVSNGISENQIKWETLWFFSERDCFEMKKFLNKNSMHVTRLKNNVQSYNFDKDNYQFQDLKTKGDYYADRTAPASACFRVSATLSNGQEIEFKALGRNCTFLSYILKKYIKENEAEN